LARFANDNNVFLLESVEGGERWGRFSILGVNVRRLFTVADGIAKIEDDRGNVQKLESDGQPPLFALRQIMRDIRPVDIPELPRCFAGAVGYIGYETVNEFERLPKPNAPLRYPTTCLALADDLIVFDNVRHTLKVVAYVNTNDYDNLDEAYADAVTRIKRMEKTLDAPIAELDDPKINEITDFSSNMSRDRYCEIVERAKEYIVAGDIIQVMTEGFMLHDRLLRPATVGVSSTPAS